MPTVSEHIKKFIVDGELTDSVIRKFRITARDGKSYEITHYALDVAFYVGYWVNSSAGVLFRRWVTNTLVQFATKGVVVDKDKLKNPEQPGIVEEFREIAREIRSSTQNMYREVKRLYTLCQDYDSASQEAREFFMCMENKLLYASANMTEPEIILNRADSSQPDMGLSYFTGKRGPTQADVKIANNYLAEGESRTKNRITDLWLTYVEDQLDQGKLVTMNEVREKLDNFVKFNEWPLLTDLGKVTWKTADTHAIEQHKLYMQALRQS